MRIVLATVLLLSVLSSGSATFFKPPRLNPIPPEVAARLDFTSPVKSPAVVIDPRDFEGASDAQADALRASIREKSRVHLPPNLFKTAPQDDPFAYSGYVLVDPAHNSNMFYWFFEAQNGDPNAPVVVWLQGGPGASSLYGLFAENGPFSVSDDLQLVPRENSWNQEFAMLYFDNPVGVGFSFTNSTDGFSTTEEQVGQNLYNAITGFFNVYNDYQKNDFYITGESYAGKYVPAFAYTIYQQNKAPPKMFVNLKGIAIGDGLVDTYSQCMGYADIVWGAALGDENQRDVFIQMQNNVQALINNQSWHAASDAFSNMVNGPPDYFQNITGTFDYYDIRYIVGPSYGGNYGAFLNQTTVRDALHVGDAYFGINGSVAGDALYDDIPKSVAYTLPELLTSYKVLFYNGQFDFIVHPVTTQKMLWNLQWAGLNDYRAADRVIWRINPSDVDVAGYVRQAGSYPVYQAIVRDAGHMVPADQPDRALDMITRFIKNIPFNQ